MRIPVSTSLMIESFAGGSITRASSMAKNCVFDQYPDGRIFSTQRPAVNIEELASDTVADARGRGCYYWSAVDALYMVNDDEVYKSTYSTTVREAGQSITTLTHNGSDTATVTITAHGYSTGDNILISGATDTSYNGTFSITKIDADNFSYTLVGTPTAPDVGSSSARRVMSGGQRRVYFAELETYLVILDPENNEGWYVASGTSTVLHKISDADFPSDLVRGYALLNGRLYVMGGDGTIYASDEGDPTSWAALNIVSANHSPDVGLYLGIHHKHVVAYGANTIEFFYDAGNPTGSPLSRRIDLVEETGVIAEDTFWTDSDVTFFVGISRTGGLAVYILANFTIAEISTPSISSFLTTAHMKEGRRFHASGAVVGGRVFYVLTVYRSGTNAVPETTLVYNAKSQTWTPWELMHTGIDDCPIVDWTLSTNSTVSKGILTTGDIVSFQDDFVPQDLTLATGILEAGIVEDGIVVESGGAGEAIEMEIITGHFDGGTRNRKVEHSCRIAANQTSVSQSMTLSWSDENNGNYTDGIALDLNVVGQRASRMGSFRQRNHKLKGSPTERVQIEGLEPEIEVLSA